MEYELYVDGRWRPGARGRTIEIRNPATGERVAEAAAGEVSDASSAMDAEAAALPAWKARTAYERAGLLVEAAALIRERVAAIARVVTEENGKPLAESTAETLGCAAWFEWFAEEAKRTYGRMVPAQAPGKRLWGIEQPVGVVAAVTPWNFPVNLPCRKLAAALAAGCTIVGRPSSHAPLGAMRIFECLHDAGLPHGAASLITGEPGPTTRALLDHPACRKLAFGDEAEAVAAANDTPYGLAAYVLVRDLATGLRVAEALEYGVVGLNDTVPTVPQAPFGGWKENGVGREGGLEGIRSYLETKFVSVE